MIIQTSIAAAIPSWFDERVNVATGIAYSGASIGTISGPLFILYFAELYGARGAFMILAGLWLQLAVVGALQRTYPEREKQAKANKQDDKSIAKTDTIVWTSDNSGVSTITITGDQYLQVGETTRDKLSDMDKSCKLKEKDGKTDLTTPTYKGLLKRPKVIRALIIVFFGITGGIGKDSLMHDIAKP